MTLGQTPAAVPYSRPKLPVASQVNKYLHQIDANRYYSNKGPLVLRLEERLSDFFGAPLITASSATSALTAALLTLDLPPGSCIATPAWTFAATPAAIIAAGHVPYFVDVDAYSQAAQAQQFFALSHSFEAIVPVVPFGAKIQATSESWAAYARDTRIPVVIDAAAAFDALSHERPLAAKCPTPVVISTHCTKTFGTGEGGLLLCDDVRFLAGAERRLNFGLSSEREVTAVGFNGKMSEYAAAVGLAELDGWRFKREQWIAAKQHYRRGFDLRASAEEEYAQSVFNIEVLPAARGPLLAELKRRGIEARVPPYGFAHRALSYYREPRDPLPNTDILVVNQVSLPFYVDMSKEAIEHVVRSVFESVPDNDLGRLRRREV